MNSFSLWIEISISGFFYVFALFFFLLTILGVKDLNFILCFKDYLAIVGVGIAIISYIFGILAHRLLSGKENDSKAESVDLWQYGSARLHKEIDFQFSTETMLKSLRIGFLLAGLCAAIWCWVTSNVTSNIEIGILACILGIVLSFLSCRAYKIQHKKYVTFRTDAFEEIKKVKRKRAK